MFLKMRRCAKSMTQLPRLKVQITVQGHAIYPWISWPPHISRTLPIFSLNFIQEAMCRIYDIALQTHGHGHTSISCFSSFNPCLFHISWLYDCYTLSFTQTFLSGETIRRTHDSANQTQMSRSQFNGIYPCIRCPLCISLTLSRISLNFRQIFIWVRQFVEPTTWQRRPKVKVTLQEYGIYPSNLVHSLSYEPFQWILLNFNLMFLSVRWFAELRDSR